jgi:MoxR-like ATPase
LPWRLALFALLLSFVPSVLRLDAAKTVPHSDQHPPKAGAFESGASKSDEAAKELVTEREHETAHRRSEAGKPEALSEHKPDAPNESGSSKKARPSSAQAPLVAADAASSQSIASPSESSESSASRSSGSQGASAGGGSAKSGKRPEGEAEEERTAKKRKSPRPRQPKGAETKKGESDASGAVPRGSSTSGGRLAAVGNKRSGVDRGEEREDDAETEDEEIEDEQEESDQRGGVMPRMRDRRASPSRDLSISGDGPPDDGRGGPSPPKKARGTASLVLGVRLPDSVRGLPNPGTAKSRIQFTPDLMPADITGTEHRQEDHETGRRSFVFQKGPIFAQIVLADEINRATPKTQSALLEAMQERRSPSRGETHRCPKPFFVLATQNPIEQEGTYPLPEAQLDRFMFKLEVGYPKEDEYHSILSRTTGRAMPDVPTVASGEEILALRELVRDVPVTEEAERLAVRLIMATQPGTPYASDNVNRYVMLGSSPRGAQALILAAKVHALSEGRFSAGPDDIRVWAVDALRHRVLLNFEALAEGLDTDKLILENLERLDVR